MKAKVEKKEGCITIHGKKKFLEEILNRLLKDKDFKLKLVNSQYREIYSRFYGMPFATLYYKPKKKEIRIYLHVNRRIGSFFREFDLLYEKIIPYL